MKSPVPVGHAPAWTAPAEGRAGPPATSTRVVLAIIAVLSVLLAARWPSTMSTLRRDFPPSLAEEISDPHLTSLALTFAVLMGALITVISMAILLWLARMIERQLFPFGLGSGTWSIGVFTATVAASVALFQVESLVMPGLDIAEGQLKLWQAVAVGIVVASGFLIRFRHRSTAAPALVLVIAAALGLLCSLG
ncbi:putative membrane hypothetical protein [metagenome]|uniref:Uncharacterized protein n=1 Tax=metagenome TaxID=256318 RepID=A0A2P2BYQ9_9ZZZZ